MQPASAIQMSEPFEAVMLMVKLHSQPKSKLTAHVTYFFMFFGPAELGIDMVPLNR